MTSAAIQYSPHVLAEHRSALMVRPRWRWWHFASAIGLIALSVWVTSDAWSDIAAIAMKDEEASHVFAPFVVAWLVWVRRGRFKYVRPRTSIAGCAIVFVGWILYSVGDSYWIQAFWHGGAVLMAMGALVTALGGEVFIEFLPAFVAGLFIIPIPGRLRQRISLPLQYATAVYTQRALELMGSGIERSGNLLRLNGVGVEIAEACNGLRMICTLGLVLFGFAFGTPLRTYVRILLIAATPVSAVLCNVIRLVPTIWVYGNFSPAFAAQFHNISGWLMLIVSFLMVMSLIRILRWGLLPVAPFHLAYD